MRQIYTTQAGSSYRLRMLMVFGMLVMSYWHMPAANAQGMHFSQYYNAPMLLNPANTGLMSDNDYRIGANYRSQWASVPVPYKTFSAYADFQAFRAKNETNWLGVGVAFYNDKAGNGDLSLNRTEGFLAYHIELGSTAMLSGGAAVAYVQRSVDFSKLTFDMQWDGATFNSTLPNGEKGGQLKTNYMDVSAGLNLAVYPNENVYIKLGGGLSHINQPKESFYGMINKMAMRPTANFDALFRLNGTSTLNPSLYYTNQKGASELVYGTLYGVLLGGNERNGEKLLLGVYHRWDEAVIGTFGFEFDGLRMMASYDVTVSQLGSYNNHNGALEIGLRWQGLYGSNSEGRRVLNCPRF